MNSLKYHLSILLCLCLSGTLFIHSNAQPPAAQWDKTFGGSADDYLDYLLQSSDGGYIFGGMTNSGLSTDITQAPRGDFDFWIVKTNSSGVKLWDGRYGGSGADVLYVVLQTSDGGYILSGYSISSISGEQTNSSRGLADYWLVKVDSVGTKQWDSRFGGSGSDFPKSLGKTSDGGYIIGGYSNSGISGERSQTSQGGYDYWIVKTNSLGVKEWDKRFGGSGNEQLYSVQQTSDGGYILGGYTDSGISGDKTEASRGVIDYWLVKTDASGLKIWDKRFGGSSNDYMNAMKQTTDGGYILGGTSASPLSGDKTESVMGPSDFWIVKTDASGIKVWDKRYGGNNADAIESLAQTADGGYIFGGVSTSDLSGDRTQASQGSNDYWLVKTNAGGTKQWDARYGGSDFDVFFALQQTTDAGYIIGGYSTSGQTGDKSQPALGGYDLWVLKLAGPCLPPSALVYSTNPAVYTVGTSITANTPSSSGDTPVSYTITPSLSSGLNFSNSTGVISGNAVIPQAQTIYTVTASNACGTTSSTLSITVNTNQTVPTLSTWGLILLSGIIIGAGLLRIRRGV